MYLQRQRAGTVGIVSAEGYWAKVINQQCSQHCTIDITREKIYTTKLLQNPCNLL